PGPTNRMVQSPGPDPGGNLIAKTEKTETSNSRSNGEGDPPPARRAIFHRAGDTLGNPAVTPPIQNQRRAGKRPLGGSDFLALSQFWCCGGAVHIQSCASELCFGIASSFSLGLAMPILCASGIFGFGLRMRAR